MPRDFPDIHSLERAAAMWRFRPRNKGEFEFAYRQALADYVQPQDLVESMEIRTGHGWNKFSKDENLDMLQRSAMRAGVAPEEP